MYAIQEAKNGIGEDQKIKETISSMGFVSKSFQEIRRHHLLTKTAGGQHGMLIFVLLSVAVTAHPTDL